MGSERSVSYLKKRLDDVQAEMQKAHLMLSEFVEKELHWNDCNIEIRFYNDMLDCVSANTHFQEFKEKYLL